MLVRRALVGGEAVVNVRPPFTASTVGGFEQGSCIDGQQSTYAMREAILCTYCSMAESICPPLASTGPASMCGSQSSASLDANQAHTVSF